MVYCEELISFTTQYGHCAKAAILRNLKPILKIVNPAIDKILEMPHLKPYLHNGILCNADQTKCLPTATERGGVFKNLFMTKMTFEQMAEVEGGRFLGWGWHQESRSEVDYSLCGCGGYISHQSYDIFGIGTGITQNITICLKCI